MFLRGKCLTFASELKPFKRLWDEILFRHSSDLISGVNYYLNDIEMDDNDIEKSKAHIIVEIIEYVADSVVVKTILKKATGSISVISIDSGESLAEKTIPFDTFVQIIDGKAEIVINGIPNYLNTGQSIIIPAHASNTVKADKRFKMISTIIKSGYE